MALTAEEMTDFNYQFGVNLTETDSYTVYSISPYNGELLGDMILDSAGVYSTVRGSICTILVIDVSTEQLHTLNSENIDLFKVVNTSKVGE